LFTPGAEEDPDWLDKKLGDLLHSPVDVEALLEAQRSRARDAWQTLEHFHPGKATNLRQRFGRMAEAARDREAVRSEITRLTRLVRQFLLQTGKLTGLGEDIFFLSMGEIEALLAGGNAPIEFIPIRRDAWQRQRSLPPYPPVIIGQFDPFRWAADPERRSDYFDARKAGASSVSAVIKGFPGAAGCVEGIVRRIDTVEDGINLQPGEILVTITTNVGWTPLFPRLRAVVTDVGAPLSHAAIVARELGIPAVVGCGDATMRLKTGDRVRVDGGAGTVTILG
jgi:pyruvate,water dikinase